MESWVQDIAFERQGPVGRVLKKTITDPLANYLPAGMLRSVLRFGKSELAAANWADPGGWRSMVISYHGAPRKVADKILVGAGTMARALRNRRRLGGKVLARLIDAVETRPVHVLCLGAGPGQIIIDAMLEAHCETYATLVDLSSEAFEYGRQLAESCGLSERVRYIQADVRDVRDLLDHAPSLLTMLGICEYLTDEQVVSIARAAAQVMPAGSAVVVNSLSKRHGTDRFFRRVFGLHMIHRSPQQIQELMAAAGLGGFDSIPEPLGVYHVIVGRKADGPAPG